MWPGRARHGEESVNPGPHDVRQRHCLHGVGVGRQRGAVFQHGIDRHVCQRGFLRVPEGHEVLRLGVGGLNSLRRVGGCADALRRGLVPGGSDLQPQHARLRQRALPGRALLAERERALREGAPAVERGLESHLARTHRHALPAHRNRKAGGVAGSIDRVVAVGRDGHCQLGRPGAGQSDHEQPTKRAEAPGNTGEGDHGFVTGDGSCP